MSNIYIATTHKATAVTTSLVCSFTSINDRNLLIVKGNIIDIYNITENGLIPVISIPINGRITKIDKFKPNLSSTDYIFILTAKKVFCIVYWDINTMNYSIKATGNLKEYISGKDLAHGHMIFVDPSYKLIGVMVLEGHIKIIPIDNDYKDAYELRLELLRPIDIKFINTSTDKPMLCMIYQDYNSNRHMKSYYIDVKDKELVEYQWKNSNIDNSAKCIIPVPLPIGGILIIGNSVITYLNHNKSTIQNTTINSTPISAYGMIDNNGSRYLLGDLLGYLYVLNLIYDQSTYTVTSLVVDYLGKTNIADSISYLDNGIVFIGSGGNASQLIKLNQYPNSEGSYIDVIEVYSNQGPISDMCIVTNENDNKSQLVTCSGYINGSLQIIRNEIGINIQASIELVGLKDIWSIKEYSNHNYDKYIIQSYINETRILTINDNELEEIESFGNFITNASTIYCSNFSDSVLIQITSFGLYLYDLLNDVMLITSYIPSNHKILLGESLNNQIIIVLSSNELLLLSYINNQLVIQKSITLDYDIACLSIYSSNDKVDQNRLINLLAVGMWSDNSIRLYDLPSLNEITRVSISVTYEIQIRDILLIDFNQLIYLFVGLGDGTLLTYNVLISNDHISKNITISNNRKLTIGTCPITFTSFHYNNLLNIFVSCDNPSIIYLSNEQLQLSNINYQSNVLTMCPFNHELFQQSICLISDTGLTIGLLDNIQKISVSSYPIEGTPKKISYHNSTGTYIVLVENISSTNDNALETKYSVNFYTNTSNTFDLIQSFALNPLEHAIACSSCYVSRKSSDEVNSLEYVIVGTAYELINEIEPSTGRLLVFKLSIKQDESKSVELLYELDVNGGVFAIESCLGRIITCQGSKIVVYSIEDSLIEDLNELTNYPVELIEESSVSSNVLVMYIKSLGNLIIVGDMIRSISLYQLNASTNKLIELGKDFSSIYLRAIEILLPDLYFGCDDSGNIFTLKFNGITDNSASSSVVDNTTINNKKLLDHGKFYLSEYINVIRSGTIINSKTISSSTNSLNDLISTDDDNPGVSKSFLFGTISGYIGTILLISNDLYGLFNQIETTMNIILSNSSNSSLSHSFYRSYQSDSNLANHQYVIDGDYIETFLELTYKQQEQIVNMMNKSNQSQSSSNFDLTVDYVIRKIEEIAVKH